MDQGIRDGECYGSAQALGAESIIRALRRHATAKRQPVNEDTKLDNE
eukprot:CAMPEP_0176396702 /NCGR_PEP_ID=MMETSP0126-20121128/44485_1 /TAXON_ID=141414 ORGANISM="Strombidinopsis acuminatum, Strain SPMC142" /NCGR_SAMPLE_ID=MMETSP0126 /ASSEMBLY_ACC=CAM_ASM_000229 /LENGTH=46 /DNA_ID= /DNA_START= /DNA_END= /DNA_ORIENTATION=